MYVCIMYGHIYIYIYIYIYMYVIYIIYMGNHKTLISDRGCSYY